MTMQNNPWVKDFPILAADENGNRLVYLDSAATTQHPTQVLDAVTNYYKHDNANPHRGVYELAMRATDAHEGARHRVAQFFHAQDDEIVFTQNTTESLNLVAYSYGMHFLHEGDEIVISVAEHHSNLVPWQRVAQATGAKLVYLYPNAAGYLTEEELDKKITTKTKLVAVGMVSNVLGLRAPVEAIVARAHAVGAVVVLDCAQSAPHMPVDVKKLDVDFAACSAHKLYAPMGMGALYARAELLDKMPPFLSGGDMIGAVHEHSATWAEGPRKFEAGTRNVGGEVGFAAALDYMPVDVKKLDVDFAACSAHKLYAPMGMGALYARAELLDKMPPFLSGGDMIGAVHEHSATWAEGPRKFEAGTRNVGGEVGFAAALDYMDAIGWDAMMAHEHTLLDRMLKGMAQMPWLTVYGDPTAANRFGVVSFNVNDVHPHDVATILDAGGVAVRAGHHCAQPLMDFLGIGSCCRASVAVYNTEADVDALLENLENVRKVMGL